MDAEQAALALVGKTVADKYRLLGLLGAGGMGAVYEAEHVFTKRRVALKRMHQGIARSKIAAERFVRESQAPSSIGHPGIVQVLDGGFEADGSLYLVLELLDGVSMGDALDENTLEPTAVTQIGVELLEALAAAHDKGFIHRDIKPDNVFLAHDGRGGVTVKLLDFGIASVRDTEGDVKLTKTGAVLGTPLYMSPEQAKGARIDARSDLWSVGAMLYRALAGIPPYTGDTYNALIVSIVTQEHVDLGELCPGLPRALLDVVDRALRKDPDARFDSATQMCEALKQVRFDDEDTGERDKSPSMPPYASLKPPANDVNATAPGGRRSKRPAREQDPALARTEHSTSLGFVNSEMQSQSRGAAGAQRAASGVVSKPGTASGTQHAQPRADAGVQGGTTARVFSPSEIEPERPLGVMWLVASAMLLAAIAYFALRPKPLPQSATDLPPSAAVEAQARPTAQAPANAAKPQDEPAAQPEATAQPAAEAKPSEAPSPEPSPKNREAAQPPAALSEEDVMRVVAEKQGDMQRCLEEAVVAQMLAGNAAPGPLRLDVELDIAPAGSVNAATVSGAAPGELASCVRARLLTLEFPRAARATSYRYPLVLAPKVVGR